MSGQPHSTPQSLSMPGVLRTTELSSAPAVLPMAAVEVIPDLAVRRDGVFLCHSNYASKYYSSNELCAAYSDPSSPPVR
jgi:hypothetical protein